MEQGYQCPMCGKPLVFLPQYQFWHCQGCGGYFQYQQTPAALQQPSKTQSKVLAWIGVSVVAFIVVMAVLWVTVFSDVLNTFGDVETSDNSPKGALTFTESSTHPGLYTGSFGSLTQIIELSNVYMEITEGSTGISRTQDPIISGISIDAGDMSATFSDINNDGQIDGGDIIRVEGADSCDNIKFVYKLTGGIIGEYNFF